MLVRGIGLFDAFDKIFKQASLAGGLDVYAVNQDGMMITNSPAALNLFGQDAFPVACRLRVSDPTSAAASNLQSLSLAVRRSQPLTYSVAGASSGKAGRRLDQYSNYSGEPVVGAWRWIDQWGLGIVVERSAETAYATANIVRFGFSALGLMLTLTALIAAARIAKRTAMAQAAVHPLSRYQLISELGSGGMGVVYRAKHAQCGS